MESRNTATVIVFSGDMDKVFAAYTLASTAAAAGMETTMFFTFWGLKAVQKGNFTGKGAMGKILGLMNRGGLERLGPSKFNFGGMGRWMFKKMMSSKGVSGLNDLRQSCLELGVHLVACKMSMDVMEIKRDDLIPEVENVAGAATVIKQASQSHINYFI